MLSIKGLIECEEEGEKKLMRKGANILEDLWCMGGKRQQRKKVEPGKE